MRYVNKYCKYCECTPVSFARLVLSARKPNVTRTSRASTLSSTSEFNDLKWLNR